MVYFQKKMSSPEIPKSIFPLSRYNTLNVFFRWCKGVFPRNYPLLTANFSLLYIYGIEVL